MGLKKRLSDHVTLLGLADQPYYLVVGDAASALVEGGISTVARMVAADLKKVKGIAPVKYLVACHSHSDHLTGLIRLKLDFPEMELVASQGTDWVLNNPKVLGRIQAEDPMYAKIYADQDLAGALEDPLDLETFPADRVVAGGDPLDLGGGVGLKFHEAEGHAPGSLCVEVLPDRFMVISDTAGYATDDKHVYPLFFQGYDLYMQTLEKIQAMEPMGLGLGHHVTIANPGESRVFLDRAKLAAQTMRHQMRQATQNGVSEESLAKTWGDQLATYGFFKYFPREKLHGYAALLIRRALE